MQSLILFFTTLIVSAHIGYLFALPLVDEDVEDFKRSNEELLPNGNFSLVTNEKLLKLKQLANAAHDSKLEELYNAVNHYVQIARKNHEYVLWKYDVNQEGLVLVLKQNLNGILYYG